ncbi:hypothetical protein FH972_001439 [Carpinus fangiana]|uniref:Legume lectin domain-containing protein n=1 Tax=Carpinus fangiana TaxID=176857 RepID=A0A5N6QBX9_9ROSI|nr:hypothetical protein FH972_001439 [Carpinus fangiana]
MAEKLFSLWVFLLLLHPVKPDVATPLLDGFSGGFNAAGNNLTLDGAAAVESNGVLLLTTYTSTMAPGHAFYSNPIQFKNSSGEVMSFSTSFAFAIIPQPGKQGGDGLAFAISPAKGILGGNPGSYIGLFNASNNGNLSNQIFAVEFDTYMNAEYGETDNNHVAVDINSIKSNKSVPVPFNLTSGRAIQAWVEAVVVLKLGLMCSNNAPKARPTMRQAVSYLEGEVALPEAVEAPYAYDGKNGGAAASEFVDYFHFYPTSSISAGNNRDVDLESGYSSSLLSIPQ